MSRLDYITIAIVAACILAIIFLINKMTSLFGDQPAKTTTEAAADRVEEDTDTTYQYDDLEDAGDTTSTDDSEKSGTTKGDQDTDDAAAPATPPPTPATTKPRPAETEETETATSVSPNRSTGKFLVIAGTFSQKASAQQHLKKLKSMGFNNASIEPFDKGKFDVVLVDRFDNMAAAERLVKDLKAEGVSSYVKIKEGN